MTYLEQVNWDFIFHEILVHVRYRLLRIFLQKIDASSCIKKKNHSQGRKKILLQLLLWEEMEFGLAVSVYTHVRMRQ